MKEMYCMEVRKAQSEQMVRQQAEDMESDYLYELFSCLNPNMELENQVTENE